MSDAASGGAAAAQSRVARRAGVADLLPVAPGVAAWGIVTGVAMVQSGLPLWACVAFSLIAFAGSAQLAALPLMLAGAPLWLITLTALAVNVRFVIYSAALRPSLHDLPTSRRLLQGYLIGDLPSAIFLQRLGREPALPARADYLLGLGSSNAVVWHGSSLIGILLAAQIPRHWGLEFAGTLAILALLVPASSSRPGLAGTLVAGTVAIVGRGWPLRMGLLAGMVAGVAAAVLAQATLSTRRTTAD